MDKMTPLSAKTIANIRALRNIHKVSAQRLAEQISNAGYPVSRSQIANYEGGRANTLPLDFVAFAAQVLGTSVYGLMYEAAKCPACSDAPPKGFTCNTCGTAAESGGAS